MALFFRRRPQRAVLLLPDRNKAIFYLYLFKKSQITGNKVILYRYFPEAKPPRPLAHPRKSPHRQAVRAFDLIIPLAQLSADGSKRCACTWLFASTV